MARKKSSVVPAPEPVVEPAPMPFTTTDYEQVKKLHRAGILAVNSYGQPMVFEYAVDDRVRIEAALG